MGFHFYNACCFLIIFSKVSTAIDTLSPSELLIHGMTLVSSDGRFELGFFSPGSSKNRHLGIWYKNIPMQTVVWVANRVNPINDSTGLLKIQSSGRIVLQAQNSTSVWSTNSTARVQNPILQLLDSGNLVVKDGKESNPENYSWQSFDYPSDTILAAWKNWDDPSPGDLTYSVELQGNPKMVQRKGSEKYYRSGLWNGDGFSGTPKWLERWNSSDWSHGCIHSKPLNCRSGDGFIIIGKVKTPDTPSSWVNRTVNLKECRTRCLRNCSCIAYTNLDVRKGGSGYVMWFGDLIDIKHYQSGGQDLYIRVSASQAGTDYEARICSYFIL
ncbi:G-type lectin S-receptor-like serine/threonine-protein kinase At4g27290 [Gossypium hirsutum]|uniref:G-type lectin S-receptor-like serine/threonine-protein kinase At4g27290 n=1 Tax=Gossypium hirsutum TaxID=3635 RepID=A0A1U8KN26_GOSHI|nr:G-type lectin S-receptor-like serine/threonine-protein kinase At4g27290 [Gossypium hirsutum]